MKEAAVEFRDKPEWKDAQLYPDVIFLDKDKKMPGKKYIVGVDIGGTKIAVGLFDASPRLLQKARILTRPQDGIDAVISRITGSIHGLFSGMSANINEAAGIGVAAPGPLNTRQGIVNFAALLDWRDVPLRDLIQRKMGGPVLLEKDTNAAAFGECCYGAGRKVSNMIYVTISTGIGGGIIINRRIYRGRHDFAGEFGHICIEPRGRLCRCGCRGCLQAYASGTALAEIAREKLAARGGKRSAVLELVRGNLDRVDAVVLNKAARQGDSLAIELWNEMGTRLGRGFSILAQLFDPDLIVIGGGLTNAWPLFRDSTLNTIRRHAYKIFLDDLRIITAALGGEAGLYGAAALILEKLGLGAAKTKKKG